MTARRRRFRFGHRNGEELHLAWREMDVRELQPEVSPGSLELTRLMLFKKSGGVEMKGHFTDTRSSLNVSSHGLKLEEFEALGRRRITGRSGRRVWNHGNFSEGLFGERASCVGKVTYRGSPLPDSIFTLHSDDKQVEFLASVVGQKLKGRYVVPARTKGPASCSSIFRISISLLWPRCGSGRISRR